MEIQGGYFMRHIPTYRSWEMMKQRCKNPFNASYAYYGERGITYDPAWESYQKFLADMGERGPGMSLDRIRNDGSYCKDNCRWADRLTQRANRDSEKVRTTKRIDSKSGLLGVCFHNRDQVFQSYYYFKQKRHDIYRGSDFFEACCRRKSYEATRSRLEAFL